MWTWKSLCIGVVLLALCFPGCGGGGRGKTPALPDPSTPPPDSGTPESPHHTPGEGQAETGTGTLHGTAPGAPGDPPIAVSQLGALDMVAIIDLTSSLPADANVRSPIATLAGQTSTYSTLPVPTDGTKRSFAFRIREAGPLTLSMTNQESVDGEPLAEPLTWSWDYRIVPLRSATESRDDTWSSRDILPFGVPTTRTLLWQKGNARTDTHDGFRLMLKRNERYRLVIDTDDDQFGDWKYLITLATLNLPRNRLIFSSGTHQPIHEPLEVEFETNLTSEEHFVYLWVHAIPVDPDAAAFRFSRYTVTLNGPAPDPVAIGDVRIDSGGGAGTFDQNGAFTAGSNFAESLWEWDFGGGAELISDAAEEARVRFLEPGTYSGEATARSSVNTVSKTFEYEVLPQVLSVELEADAAFIPYGIPIKLTAVTSHPTERVEWDLGSAVTPPSAFGRAIEAVFEPAGGSVFFGVRVLTESGLAGTSEYFLKSVKPAASAPTLSNVTLPSGIEGELVIGGVDIDGPFTRVEWQLDDGATLSGGSDFAPQFTLGIQGSHSATVQAFNGDIPGLPVEVEYAVESTTPIRWGRSPLLPAGEPIYFPSLEVVNGKPVVAWHRPIAKLDQAETWVAFATTPLPQATSDWLSYQLDVTPGPSTQARQITIHEGRVQLLYAPHYSSDLPNRWASANIPLPLSPADWTIHTAPGENPTHFEFVGGRPLFSTNVGAALQLYQGKMAEPITDDDWTSFTYSIFYVPPEFGGPTAPRPYFFDLNSRLVIPFDSEEGLHVLVGDSLYPASKNELTEYALTQSSHLVGLAPFVIGNRLHLLSSIDEGPYSYPGPQVWHRALVAVPTSPGDWVTTDFGSGEERAFRGTALTVDGRPALIQPPDYQGDGQVILLRANLPLPDHVSAWSMQRIGTLGEFQEFARAVDTAMGPIIVTMDDATGQAVLLSPE